MKTFDLSIFIVTIFVLISSSSNVDVSTLLLINYKSQSIFYFKILILEPKIIKKKFLFLKAFNRECWRQVQSNFVKLRCNTDADCTYYTKCIDKKCEIPCNTTCKMNEEVCMVRSHSAKCRSN